jgi:hypothetical protein
MTLLLVAVIGLASPAGASVLVPGRGVDPPIPAGPAIQTQAAPGSSGSTVADLAALVYDNPPVLARGVGSGVFSGPNCASATRSGSSAGGRLELAAGVDSNPWMPGSPIHSTPAPRGFQMDMAMAPGQVRPGAWGTLDSIPDVSYVRKDLAVTPGAGAQLGRSPGTCGPIRGLHR